MPRRKTPLVNGEYYHVFNRTQNKEHVFTDKKICDRVLGTLNYYRFSYPPTRFAYFLKKSTADRNEIIKKMTHNSRLVTIVAYCIMPNHFHLLLRQDMDAGISRYLSLFQNSITKYRNVRDQKEGHLFKGQYKSVRIEDDEQLLHVHRYIHLNPYTSHIVNNIEDLKSYHYSSLPDYLTKNEGVCDLSIVMANFADMDKYKKFVFDHADYQRKLGELKHLVFD